MTNKQAMNMARKLEEFCREHNNCKGCIFNATPDLSVYQCAFDKMDFHEPSEWGSVLSEAQVINENLMKEE